MADSNHTRRVLAWVAVLAHHYVRLVGHAVRVRDNAVSIHNKARACAFALLFCLPGHEPAMGQMSWCASTATRARTLSHQFGLAATVYTLMIEPKD